MASRVPLSLSMGGPVLLAQAGQVFVGYGASVYVGTTGTDVTNPANQVTVYTAKTGAGTLSQPLTADGSGNVAGWIVAEVELDVKAVWVSPTLGTMSITYTIEPVAAADAGGGSSGMTNPMTAAGDLIIGGAAGAPGRLAIGSSGQLLTVSGGAPAWITGSGGSGMANPMTAAGDLIIGGSGGAPSRLGHGADFQKLQSLAGVPVWVGPERVPLFPSGDTSGATDDTNFIAACTRLNGSGGNPAGGEIVMVADYNVPFYTKNTSSSAYTSTGWSPPAQVVSGATGGGPVCLVGVGMPVLMPVGSAVTGIWYHRTGFSSGSSGGDYPVGYVRDIVVDGTNATGASVGIDAGDAALNMHVRATAKNFLGSGAVAFNQLNRVFFTEKCTFEVWCYNSSTAAVIDSVTGGANSHEYNVYDLIVHASGSSGGVSLNQNGVIVKAGVGRCRLNIRGNMNQSSASGSTPTNNIALLSVIGANSKIYNSHLVVGAEINSPPPSGTPPWAIYQDSNGIITNCSGHINIAHGFNGWSNASGNECTFNGPVTLTAQPDWPASGNFNTFSQPGATSQNPSSTGGSPATWTNLGVPANFCVAGANCTDCLIDNQSLGSGNGPPWFGVIGPGSQLSIKYSGGVSGVRLSITRAIGGG